MARGSTEGAEISKMGAVREALQEMGRKAKPLAIKKHIMEKHGIDMAPTLISSYKTTIQKKGGRSGIHRRAGGRPAGGTPGRKSAVNVEDVRKVKELTDRIGHAKVRELVDLLA
jgi:hypothetical protein